MHCIIIIIVMGDLYNKDQSNSAKGDTVLLSYWSGGSIYAKLLLCGAFATPTLIRGREVV